MIKIVKALLGDAAVPPSRWSADKELTKLPRAA